ncbi:hypothetical protein ACVWZM_005625 [Bradyrhizobium sp. USDA 4501]|nr:hypothetical protein [Bradyrhizobium elkanii]
MHIAQLALAESVPPKLYGGARLNVRIAET